MSFQAEPANGAVERLQSLGERRLSRRAVLQLGAAVAVEALLIEGGHQLKEGVSFNKPPLTLRTVSIEKGEVYQPFLLTNDQEPDNGTHLIITSEGRLLIEPDGQFFVDGRDFSYIHRANNVEMIQNAYDIGANMFDIDVNLVKTTGIKKSASGVLIAEHGIVPQVEVSIGGRAIRITLPGVIDINEKEVKLGMPKYTYEDLVAYIESLSTPENVLAVSAELKRGNFEPETLGEIIRIHKKYNIPAVIHSTDLEYLSMIGVQAAQLFDQYSI